MDFERHDDDAELTAFRDEVETWVAAAMSAAGDVRWTVKGTSRLNPPDVEIRAELARALGDKGWLFPTYPTEYGGSGLTWRHALVLESALSRYRMTLKRIHLGGGELVPTALLKYGTDEQKAKFLPGFVTGRLRYWMTMTEPQGGSDAANVKTTAILDGDHYVVNGQKVLVGGEGDTDYLFALLCTDPGGKRHENLGWFLVPADAPGVAIHKNRLLNGLKNTIHFDDVRIPADHLIGSRNEGWQKVGATVLELEHGGGGLNVGNGSAVSTILNHCRRTMRGDRPLIEHDDVRELLSHIVINNHVLSLFGTRNFWHRFTNDPHPYGGSQMKYWSRMVQLDTSTRLRQVAGYSAFVQNLELDEEIDLDYISRLGIGSYHGGGTGDTDRVTAARRLGLGRGAASTAPATA